MAATVGFWSQPDHHRRQANRESLFVADGVPCVVVKSCPGNGPVTSGG